ncbi:1525_t:CDS:2, partial [Dentiscutata heterogama]
MKNSLGLNYFQNNEPSKWSLIGFLKWRYETQSLLDRTSEHSAFKSFLQEFSNEDIIKAKRAQELLNNWEEIKRFPEVKNFWNDIKTRNLKNDIQHAKMQNELKTLQVEAEDLNYVLDRKKELNLHANIIGSKRKLMLQGMQDDSVSKNKQRRTRSGRAIQNYVKSVVLR